MITWRNKAGLEFATGDRRVVMGIVNVTPDSFSDGGLVPDAETALAGGLELVSQGAGIIDIGGESSRPGAEPVPLEVELERVLPAIKALAGRTGVPISIDTAKPAVARMALEAGAAIVNSIQGAQDDPEIDQLIAKTGAGIILMHMQGNPQTMQIDPNYADVTVEVLALLEKRIDRLRALGVERAQIAIDPGIGFGKTIDHNLTLLRRIDEFAALGCAIVVGTSRKKLLGKLTGTDVHGRSTATIASCLWSIARGAQVVRVHEVGPMVDAIRVWKAIESGINK